MTNIRKSDLYEFLRNKKTEQWESKVKPLEEKYRTMKTEYAQKLYDDLNIDKNKTMKAAKTLVNTLQEIRDNVSNFHYLDMPSIRNLQRMESEEEIVREIKKGIYFRDVPEIDLAMHQSVELNARINDEFKKITSAVKACTTAKQGLELLTNLGFDTSSIQPVTKNELMTFTVDSKLLGLPEEKGKQNEN